MQILLLEDDHLLLEIIEEHLAEQGHTVVTAMSGSEADEKFMQCPFDLLLLDVNVPGMTGFELLKTLRQEGFSGAAIFITSLQSTEDLKTGFAAGADDYIRKPFDLDELDARIANIRRLTQQDSALQLSDFITLNVDAHQLIIDGQVHNLRHKECRVLAHLIRQKGKIVSQEELIQAAWGYDERPDDSTLRTYIKTLRKLLGEGVIQTIRNAGYRVD